MIRLVHARKFSSSALYITGDKAQKNFAVLTPYIDFNNQLANKSEIIKNIRARKLLIDLNKIEQRWNFFQMIDDHKNILEFTRNEIANLITNCKDDSIEKLKLHLKLVKGDLKNVKEYYYGVEENAVLGVLSLPNIIHKKTPHFDEVVLHSFGEAQILERTKSHLEIANGSSLINFSDTNLIFLNKDAALFEFALCNYFHDYFTKLNFIQASNADFARSVVIEGCGFSNNLDKSNVFTIDEGDENDLLNRLHLAGGASLYSFMAYFTKNSIQPSYFPIKYFTIGRKYQPISDKNNLFNMSQESVLQVFIAALNYESINEISDKLIGNIIELYEQLGFHFKLIYVPAFNLRNNESLRLSIQMYSNHLQKYIEVGNLSFYDEYLSKRLLLTYPTENKKRNFPKVIAGSLGSAQKILGCVLENNASTNNNNNNNQSLVLNEFLLKYVP